MFIARGLNINVDSSVRGEMYVGVNISLLTELS